MEAIADFMHQALLRPRYPDLLAKLRPRCNDFCRQFPLFAEEWPRSMKPRFSPYLAG